MDVGAALGSVWTSFMSFYGERVEHHRARLSSIGTAHGISPEDVVSHELGIYAWQPGTRVFPAYDATPRNAVPFAHTGMDGEHFSVSLEAEIAGAIILTAPMAFGNENVVVGRTIEEFLALGCVSGFSSIPDLAMADLEQAVTDIEARNTHCSSFGGGDPAACLTLLRSRLALTPWDDIPTRLAELDAKVRPWLVPTRV